MSPKTILIGLVIFIAATVGLSFLLTAGEKPEPPTVSYSANESDRPIAETAKTFTDVGDIKVSDVKVEDFTVKNTGTKPLQLSDINSSCGCTSGQIIYKGETSKEFSMHKRSGLVAQVDPGDTATVRLTYRPATMPVYGFVERAVFVSTNDPKSPKLTFSIKANVK